MGLHFKRAGFCIALIALAGAVGCGGVRRAVLLRENEELRFENEQTRNALSSAHAELESRQQGLQKLESERARLAEQAQTLETKLGAATQQAATLESQRSDLRTKLARAQEEEERQRQALEKLKEAAGVTANELAELRFRSKEIEDANTRLTASEGNYRQQFEQTSRGLAQAQDELTRLKAVLRSFQEATSEKALASANPAERIQQLERELAGLRGENITLRKELETRGQGAGEGPGGASQGPSQQASSPPPVVVSSVLSARATDNEVYRENPAGLVREISGLVQERVQRAQRGEIVWDFFDFAILGAIILPLLVGLYILVGRRRYKALLAEALAAKDGARKGARPEDSQAAAGGEAPRIPRSTSVRRVGFSPVITSKGVPPRTAPKPAREEGKEEEWETVLQGGGPQGRPARAPGGAPGGAPAPRKAPQARDWEETADSDASADDLAHTQVISRDDLDTAIGDGDTPPSPGPAIGPGFKAQARKPTSEEAILDELKAAINRRFDDFLKK